MFDDSHSSIRQSDIPVSTKCNFFTPVAAGRRAEVINVPEKIHRLTWLNKKAPDFVRNVTAEENRGEVLDFGPGSIEPQLSA
ncbi:MULTISPECIES: hypothetical protein [Sphingobium]|uniref:hypothetical protein n=1 Tax=Sphingobium TaxID=165695 RepID=UPI0028A94980|nr:hypothetical protein [Sphingobium yanoikuyae]